MLLPPALGFSPHPPVSVYCMNALQAIAAFLDGKLLCFTTFIRSASRLWIMRRFFLSPPSPLAPVFPFPAHIRFPCPRSSVITQYRNLHLLSIGYASPPRLRPRLTQGRSALPWNPWIFGPEDSSFPLSFRHSLFLCLHCPFNGSAFYGFRMLLYRSCNAYPGLGGVFQPPDIFGAAPLDQ